MPAITPPLLPACPPFPAQGGDLFPERTTPLDLTRQQQQQMDDAVDRLSSLW